MVSEDNIPILFILYLQALSILQTRLMRNERGKSVPAQTQLLHRVLIWPGFPPNIEERTKNCWLWARDVIYFCDLEPSYLFRSCVRSCFFRKDPDESHCSGGWCHPGTARQKSINTPTKCWQILDSFKHRPRRMPINKLNNFWILLFLCPFHIRIYTSLFCSLYLLPD